MKPRFTTLLVVILVVLLFPVPIAAQPPLQEGDSPKLCRPVDLVLLIDQSESMSTNDPNDLRLDAAKAVIQNLYYNAAIECEDIVTHRIAAIGFGDEPWIIIPLTEIFVADGSDTSWEQAMRDLQYELDTNRREPYTRVGLGLVNHPNSAQSVLESAPPVGDESLRQRVIILVTDGVPDTPEARSADRFNAEWVRHYFWGNQRGFENDAALFDTPNGLIREVRNKLSGIEINVIMFSPRPEEDLFGGTGDAWREIVGFSGGVYIPPVDITGFDDVTASITDMLNEWFGTNVIAIECDQPIYLQPYLSSTTIFTAARPNTSQSIQIVDPTGAVIPHNGRADVTYAPLETQEQYIITNPIPGEWRIQGDPLLCDSIDAKLSTTSIDVDWNSIPADVPVQVAAPHTTDVANAYIELYLTDRRGNNPIPFEPEPEHPLNMCAKVRGPVDRPDLAQYQWPECLTFTQIADGIWRSDTPVPAPRQGTYSIELTATVKSVIPGDDREIDVFAEPLHVAYGTAEPVSAQLRVVSPEDGATLPLNDLDQDSGAQQINEPVSVAIQPVLQDGTPITVAEMFYEEIAGELTLQATIQSSDGSINETVSFVPDSEDPTVLLATLRRSVDDLDPAGSYTISYTLANSDGYNSENYVLSTPLPVTTVDRIMHEGVKFEFVNTPDSLTRNTLTDDGTIQNQPVNFSVRMVNQSGVTLDVPTVFGPTSEPLAEAFLWAADGTQLDSTTLTLDDNDPSLFHGTLLDQRDVLTLPDVELQTIGVRFVANALPESQQKHYRLLVDPTEGEITREQVRFRRHGFSVQTQIVNTRDAASLNTIERGADGYHQVPVPITVTSCFYDHHDPLHTCLDAEQVAMMFGDLDEVSLVAELLGNEQETLANAGLTSNGDGSFSVTLTASSSTETDFIGSEGTHTIRVSLESGDLPGDSNATYQPIEDVAQATIDRAEVLGVTLELERMGAEGDLAAVNETGQGTTDNPLPISLYSSIQEAVGIPLLFIPPQPAEVPIRFILTDTRGNAVFWESIAQSDDALNDLLQVQIVDAGSVEPVMVENLAADTRGGVPVITGGIANANASGGVYTLSYRLNSQYLDTDRVVNLSGAPAEVTFTREITSLLLNPILWTVLEVIIDLALLFTAFILLRAFTFGAMRGTIKVMYTRNVQQTITQDVHLGRRWRRHTSLKVPNVVVFDTSGQPKEALLIITIRGNGFFQCADYDVNVRVKDDSEDYDEQDLNVLAENNAQDQGAGCVVTYIPYGFQEPQYDY